MVSGNDKIVVGNGEERRMEKSEETESGAFEEGKQARNWGDGADLGKNSGAASQ